MSQAITATSKPNQPTEEGMTLKDALAVFQEDYLLRAPYRSKRRTQALQLGIEAFKRFQTGREWGRAISVSLLPGEVKQT